MIDRRRVGWRLLQTAFVVAVLWFSFRLLAGQWAEVQALRAALTTDWLGVLASAAVVLAAYAILIATWRATVRAWGERLGAAAAARIWFVSNLGRYVPGKVWQIGAMGVLAQRVGVSPVAAVGSSLVIAVIHLMVGFAVVAVTGRELLASVMPDGPWVGGALVALTGAVVASPWLVGPLVRLGNRITRRELASPHLPARAIWVASAGSTAAWVLYGLAFQLLAVALLGSAAGEASSYVAVFTLSYLLGFLALPAPGGIGVREVSLATLLVSAGLATGPQAAWLAVASRLWLTVLEILPGAAFLLVRPAHSPPSNVPDDLRRPRAT